MDAFQGCEWDSDSTAWGKGGSGKINFLKAGSGSELQSVGPNHEFDIQEIGDEDADEADDSGMDVERISVEDEGAVVKKVKDPTLPIQLGVDKHYVKGHIPYRDWCPVCVQAQGREMGHMQDENKEWQLPEYSWDYCFPGDELGFKWSVLVGKEGLKA